jgi:2-dehydro-3-deoxyphosphogluconate aldolase/(4S)-4-hydroxy-2-oxoglutarate aldolase
LAERRRREHQALTMRIAEVVAHSPVIPVLTIHDAASAAPLASALARGGVRVIEVTLRTPAALDAIRAIRDEAPDVIVGAGTILTEDDLQRSRDAGACFAVSPGSTSRLLQAARAMNFPFLPGVATASEIMQGLAHDYAIFKFFPAESVGGIAALEALSAPFSQVRFCPTGGVTLESAPEYLELPGVVCVGGSWLAPLKLIERRDWKSIEALAAKTTAALAK